MNTRNSKASTIADILPAERFSQVLRDVFAGSQTQMAKALGCSQSVLSRIVKGRQQPGARLLEKLADHPAVNRAWALTGRGEPLTLQLLEYDGEAALPIAREPFAGLPYDNPQALEDGLYPVSRRWHRRSRYWVRMTAAHLFVHDPSLKIAAADMVLFEADPAAWPDDLRGLPCLVSITVGDEARLLHCRSTTPSKSNCTTRDFDTYQALIGIEKSAEQTVDGRPLRAIQLETPPQTTEPPCVYPAEIVALAILRTGPI